jgi:RNA methyltransferase, TrmH family
LDYFWVVPIDTNKVLSKNKIKLIRSLDLKKNRIVNGLFVAEGERLVGDILKSEVHVSEIFCTNHIAPDLLKFNSGLKIEIVSKDELSRISFLKTTPEIVALCKIPKLELDWEEIKSSLTLVLDEIQDPGNLGTIVRLADWFGIRNVICSEGCADLYNPKVIQSTMGAFARVKVSYVSLSPFLENAKRLSLPVYGAFLEGDNLYKCDLTENGIIVMGNEGNGISDIVAGSVMRKINIPSFPPGEVTSESLNVAIATSVICAEFRRRVIYKG